MGDRKHRLVDCNPNWVEHAGVRSGLRFDCPEGHRECRHTIPFTPSLEGAAAPSWYSSGATWERTGDTFETLTLSPSIRRQQLYLDRAAAIAAGYCEENIEDSMFCALHIVIKAGAIEFCGDSR